MNSSKILSRKTRFKKCKNLHLNQIPLEVLLAWELPLCRAQKLYHRYRQLLPHTLASRFYFVFVSLVSPSLAVLLSQGIKNYPVRIFYLLLSL